MKYRADIEGLRAVAILPVVLFHYKFGSVARGGFVGVDVFFVISGYLITSIIQPEMTEQRFSLLAFYARRVRRLFPALFVMVLICLVVATVFCLPPDAARIGRASLSAVLFVANLFNGHVGYFGQNAKYDPLLHAWSLSVEEQFYLLFPVLLLAARRVTRRADILVLLAALASFATSAWMGWRDPSGGFYLPQTRAWELLLGALLARGAVPTLRHEAASELLAGAGLAMIAVGVTTFDRHMAFPGVNALVPCLGAALVIHAGTGRETRAGALLGLRPIRFLGAISYSLYLWHWPVIAFYRLIADEPTSHAMRAALMAVSVGLAILSWRYVERPFRQQPLRHDPARWLGAGGAAMAGLGALAMVAGPAAAARWAGPHQAVAVLAYLDDRSPLPRQGTCFLTGREGDVETLRRGGCLVMDEGRPNILLMGDSHAAHLWQALATANPEVNFLEAAGASCKPVPATGRTRWCRELVDFIYRDFLPAHRLDGLLLSADWRQSDLPQLSALLERLRPLVPRVTVLGPIVEYDAPLPRLLAQSSATGDPGLVARHRLAAQPALDLAMKRSLAGSGTAYISLYRTLCAQEACTIWAAPDVPLQFDNNHLTADGARLVAASIRPALLRAMIVGAN